jgi:hypothetical protein
VFDCLQFRHKSLHPIPSVFVGDQPHATVVGTVMTMELFQHFQ